MKQILPGIRVQHLLTFSPGKTLPSRFDSSSKFLPHQHHIMIWKWKSKPIPVVWDNPIAGNNIFQTPDFFLGQVPGSKDNYEISGNSTFCVALYSASPTTCGTPQALLVPTLLCAVGIRNMPRSAIISIISLKEVNLCWNEELGSFFEPKLAQPESKVFTDIKSFFLDSAALKTSDRKKENHLH